MIGLYGGEFLNFDKENNTMTNSSLIAVFNGTITNQSVQLANARELHMFLEVKTQFGNWITDRISDYGFVQDEDYIIVTERTAGRPRKEYHITLDMGKELAMVERNKGRQSANTSLSAKDKFCKINQNSLPNAKRLLMTAQDYAMPSICSLAKKA